MIRPRVFIASAREALDIAREIHRQIIDDCVVINWYSGGVFKPMNAILDDLIGEQCDFAIFVASPEDVVHRRGELARVARDNIIFETGLSIGRLGKERTFLIRGQGTKLPGDFDGINVLVYQPTEDDQTLQSNLLPACYEISKRIRRLGPTEPLPGQPIRRDLKYHVDFYKDQKSIRKSARIKEGVLKQENYSFYRSEINFQRLQRTEGTHFGLGIAFDEGTLKEFKNTPWIVFQELVRTQKADYPKLNDVFNAMSDAFEKFKRKSSESCSPEELERRTDKTIKKYMKQLKKLCRFHVWLEDKKLRIADLVLSSTGIIVKFAWPETLRNTRGAKFKIKFTGFQFKEDIEFPLLVVEATENCHLSFCYRNHPDIKDIKVKETYMLNVPTIINEKKDKMYSVSSRGAIMGASHLSFVMAETGEDKTAQAKGNRASAGNEE